MIFKKKKKADYVPLEQHIRTRTAFEERLLAKDREIEQLKQDNINLLKSALEHAQQKAKMLEELKKLVEINRSLMRKLKEK